MNEYDSNRIYDLTSEIGFKKTDIKKEADCFVLNTCHIRKKATENGLIKIFLDAGAVVGPPTCGACCGAQMGVLAKDEVCVSTTNRNFPGRMGDLESKAYLASPLVTAASAVTGKLTDPRDL